MNEKNVQIITDSISITHNRITTFLLDVPQIIVKELLRHRMFSFSSSSMRAIPFNKIVKNTRENMFVPSAFQSHHSGMQGTEYLTGEEFEKAKRQWIESGLKACDEAEKLYNLGVTKQICSRIIEPFGYAKILVTATEWDNFFELRCPQYVENYLSSPESVEWSDITFKSKKDAIKRFSYLADFTEVQWRAMNESQAEIHIQALAESIWDAMNESTPKQLEAGEWHIPFGDQISMGTLEDQVIFKDTSSPNYLKWMNPAPLEIQNEDDINLNLDYANYVERLRCKIAVARCARLSYMTHEGEINYEKDIALHDHLLASGHFSPFEHVAKCMSEEEYYDFVKGVVLEYESGNKVFSESAFGWCNNFRGWIPYRYLVE